MDKKIRVLFPMLATSLSITGALLAKSDISSHNKWLWLVMLFLASATAMYSALQGLRSTSQELELQKAVLDTSVLLRLHQAAVSSGEADKSLEKLVGFLKRGSFTLLVPTPVLWELEKIGNPNAMMETVRAFHHLRTTIISPTEKLGVESSNLSSISDRVILSSAKHSHALLVTQDAQLRRAAVMEGIAVIGLSDMETDVARVDESA